MPLRVATLLLGAALASAGNNLEAGQAYLAENGDKDGVITTASGLQYRVIQSATNKSAPRPGPAP